MGRRFEEVDLKSGLLAEVVKKSRASNNVPFRRRDKNRDVVREERRAMAQTAFREKAGLSSGREHGVENVHDDDEQHGGQGSPCFRPPRCWIGSPGTPLIRILVVAVPKRSPIQSSNLLPKPLCSRTSKRNGHCTESNAFVISSLRRTEARLTRCRYRVEFWTSMKLSCRLRPSDVGPQSPAACGTDD